MTDSNTGKSVDKLLNKLSEMFRLDQEDLDFGIYRLMNQKRDEILKFFREHLLPQVHSEMGSHQSLEKEQLKRELEQHISMIEKDGLNPEESKKTQELRNRIAEFADADAAQDEVFEHLHSFFSRYYDKGDFISKRRYKDGIYMLPYNGEEIKLTWANSDQYYVKTTPMLKNYSFVTDKGHRVTFEITSGSTELNNNTLSNGKKRLLTLAADPIQLEDSELIIRFNYEILENKNANQNSINEQTLETVRNHDAYEKFGLSGICQLGNGKESTLLEKHLCVFSKKHNFDYFVHKNLQGFLERELDNYVKSEVLDMDSFESESSGNLLLIRDKTKLIRRFAMQVIQFLAQFEEFQKKMWLKKKFVLNTEYYVTLDHILGSSIESELLNDIANNEAQLQEWKDIYSFEMGNKKEAVATLRENTKLSVNTKHFDSMFKFKLLGLFDDLDSAVDGIVFNSDNFQALNLLQKKYKDSVDAIYVDPPYNTGSTEILYKNGYRSSSWLSLMQSRLELGRKLLKSDGLQCTTIDDAEFHKLRELISLIFEEENVLGVTAIKNNPSGRSTVRGFSITHEYGIFVGKSSFSSIGRLSRTEKQNDRYKMTDEKGRFEWVNFRKHGGSKSDAPRMFYPIYIRGDSIRFPEIKNGSDGSGEESVANSISPDIEWDENSREWRIVTEKREDEIVVFPIDEHGRERRWKWSIERALQEQGEFTVHQDKTGKPYVYLKSRLNESGILPYTIWDNKLYSATAHGTNHLTSMFGTQTFTYPKSVWAVLDSLVVLGVMEDSVILDYFAGSGTTAEAAIRLNREDGGSRKYILVEMGTYVENVTIPRVLKAAYSDKWKNGKPDSQNGVSHVLKYVVLEQYEDTLNNINLEDSQRKNDLFANNQEFYKQYMLEYMLDIESKNSQPLFNIDSIANPFEYKLRAVINDSVKTVKVDLIETFNYLLGLHVLNCKFHANGIVTVAGKTKAGETCLIIWRNFSEIDNSKLDDWFKDNYASNDSNIQVVYVNCDSNLECLKTVDRNWVVRDIDTEFKRLMFEENDG